MSDEKISGILPSNYHKIQQRLASFVFNEKEVLRDVAFSQFISNDGHLCYGLILPKEGEDGQFMQHVVIGSKGFFLEVKRSLPELRDLGVKFSSLPVDLPKRYSLTLLPQWVHNQAVRIKEKEVKPTLAEVYADFKAGYEKYLYFGRPEWYVVHALWDLGTYFFSTFPAYPYMELRGVKGSAKTKVMDTSRLFSFNPTPVYTSPTEAVLFRVVHDQRPTLYLDEVENLFKVFNGRVEHDGRVEVLNSGYTQSGRVPRIEKRGKRFVTEVYATYCPKMLGSINGLRGATESRAVVHVMTRAPDRDVRGELEVEPDLPEWQLIRNKAITAGLLNHEAVTQAYHEVSSAETNLKKRYFQLWRPLLALAKLVSQESYDACLKIAQQQQDLGRAEEISQDTWEGLLLQRMHDLIRSGYRKILIKDIAEAIPADERPGNKAVGTMLGKLGFRECWQHFAEGNGYMIESEELFRTIVEPLAPYIFSSSRSAASEKPEFDDLGSENLNDAEESPEILNNPSEHPERPDSDERAYDTECNRYSSESEHLLRLISANKEPMPIKQLSHQASQFDGFDFDSWLKKKLADGELYQPRPDVVGVLE